MESSTAATPTGRTPSDDDRPVGKKAQEVMDAANSGDLIGAVGEGESFPEVDSGREAVREAAKAREPERVDPATQMDALEWFLGTDEGDFTKALRLNVGGPVDDDGTTLDPNKPPVWIDWVVQPIDLETIKRIRRQSVTQTRAQRRSGRGGGEFDETLFNLGVVVEATVSPDVRQAAGQLNMADPRKAVELRFQNKSGLVGQIVGEILDLSGYNESDVQEAGADGVAAAGN